MKSTLLLVTMARAWSPPAMQRQRYDTVTIPSKEWVPSFRSSFASACAQRWLGSAVSRGQVAYGSADVQVTDDLVVGVKGSNVTWYGNDVSPLLQLSSVDVEWASPHKRALSRGRKGGFKATVTLSARDLESSSWIKDVLGKLLVKLINEIDPSKSLESFRATIGDDTTLRLHATCTDGLEFSVTSKFQAENGAATLRDPMLIFDDPTSFHRPSIAGGMLVPAPVIERLGSLYLSTVALDATRGHVRLDDITVVTSKRKKLQFTFVSGPSSAAVLEKHGLYFQRRRQDHTAAKSSRREPDVTVSSEPPLTKRPPQRMTTEWRVDRESLEAAFTGSAPHPLRHTYVLGDQWPWILNPRNSAPLKVSAAFAVLGVTLSALAVPETAARAVVAGTQRSLRIAKTVYFRFGRRLIKVTTSPVITAVVVAGRSIADGFAFLLRCLSPPRRFARFETRSSTRSFHINHPRADAVKYAVPGRRDS